MIFHDLKSLEIRAQDVCQFGIRSDYFPSTVTLTGTEPRLRVRGAVAEIVNAISRCVLAKKEAQERLMRQEKVNAFFELRNVQGNQKKPEMEKICPNFPFIDYWRNPQEKLDVAQRNLSYAQEVLKMTCQKRRITTSYLSV